MAMDATAIREPSTRERFVTFARACKCGRARIGRSAPSPSTMLIDDSLSRYWASVRPLRRNKETNASLFLLHSVLFCGPQAVP